VLDSISINDFVPKDSRTPTGVAKHSFLVRFIIDYNDGKDWRVRS